jgi:hypothetical protein
MSQKLLKGPVRLLLIAFVVTPALTVGIHAATPRVSSRPAPSNHSTNTVRVRARTDIYFNEGIERWGLNE